MKTFLFVILVLVCCLVYSVQAQQDKPSKTLISIKDSRSPDGQFYITITDTYPHEEGDAFTANVRDVKTGKSFFEFEWENGPRPANHPDENAFSVFWRKDGKVFATGFEVAFGESDCEVFARFDDGKFHEVEVPISKLNLDDKFGLKSKGKGYTTVAKWLPHNRFVIQVSDSRWDKDYQVTLRFSTRLTSSPKAIVETMQPLAKSEPDFHP